jgi:hypothetical protein
MKLATDEMQLSKFIRYGYEMTCFPVIMTIPPTSDKVEGKHVTLIDKTERNYVI